MRLTWAVIDEAPARPRYTMPITEQINTVLHTIEDRATLSPQERYQVQQYLCDRKHLIQELYQAQVM
ncbi:MAG: hypothetical protein AAFP03_16155 [Cyanobacteria bacterium J06598_3]